MPKENTQKRADELDGPSVTELIVYIIVSEGNTVTAGEMDEQMGVTEKTVRSALGVLMERALIKREGSKKNREMG
ncbi:MAG: hypothetical protein FWH47_05725 [Methanomassiliicoccaceae archaeon]|nr:hypothetical protein [Methanomassiliicoccaceae archaeon]